jgi:uncharacterized protein (TIGR04222 family)
MSNPFDLQGPDFLLFYFVLCVAVLVVQGLLIRAAESGEPPALALDDPYEIAYLRGGAAEAARVALLSLIDRGILQLRVERPGRGTPRPVILQNPTVWHQAPRLPLEQAIYTLAEQPVAASTIPSRRTIVEACEVYRQRLAERGLVPDEAAKDRRWTIFLVSLAVVLGVAGIRLALAWIRHRPNVGFLVIMAVAASFLVARPLWRRRTRIGDQALQDLSRLFGGLRQRASSLTPGAMTADAMLLAAVFGLAALPTGAYGELQRSLLPQSGSSGSSCSSSSCSSGGSSCGGGGGCGGCGS